MEKDITPRKPLSLWHNHDYLLLWLGQAVSSLGTGISQLAFPLLILAFTHSPAAAGFAAALQRIPYLLFSLPAGALVDRWDRKYVMIVCTTGLALSLASIPIALISGYLTIIQIYLVSFITGTFGVFYELAILSSVAHVVTKAQLPTAVLQNEAVYSTVSLLAPSLSGFLYSAGRLFPFVADAISYLALLGALFGIRGPLQREREDVKLHLLTEIQEGIQWLWSHRTIFSLAFLSGYLHVVENGSVLIVVVIAQQHHVPASIIGVIFAIGGVGNIIGTLLSAPIQRRVRFGRSLISMLILLVLLLPFYSIASTPLFLCAVVAGFALIDSITSILVASYRLTMVPDELQGRVGSVYRLILYGSLTLALALIGASLQRFGVPVTVAALWSWLLLFTFLMLVSRQVRQATFPKENP